MKTFLLTAILIALTTPLAAQSGYDWDYGDDVYIRPYRPSYSPPYRQARSPYTRPRYRSNYGQRFTGFDSRGNHYFGHHMGEGIHYGHDLSGNSFYFQSQY
jgi:hypothetical protein